MFKVTYTDPEGNPGEMLIDGVEEFLDQALLDKLDKELGIESETDGEYVWYRGPQGERRMLMLHLDYEEI